ITKTYTAEKLCKTVILGYKEEMLRILDLVSKNCSNANDVKSITSLCKKTQDAMDYTGPRIQTKEKLQRMFDVIRGVVSQIVKAPVKDPSKGVIINPLEQIDGYFKDIFTAWDTLRDAEVLYGDTDSVMVRFGQCGLGPAFRIGKKMSLEITTELFSKLKPVSLTFEKVYFPYILFTKKKYAGRAYAKVDQPPKTDAKGIEVKRRDNCKMVRNVLNGVLEQLLVHRAPEGAVKIIQEAVSQMKRGDVDIGLLVITKSLSRPPSEYGTLQPHVALALKKQKRDPSYTPSLGDRIPYVIVKGTPHEKVTERAEDPLFALSHQLPIDMRYYVTVFLVKALERILKPVKSIDIKKALDVKTKEVVHQRPISEKSLGLKARIIERCIRCNCSLEQNTEIRDT